MFNILKFLYELITVLVSHHYTLHICTSKQLKYNRNYFDYIINDGDFILYKETIFYKLKNELLW